MGMVRHGTCVGTRRRLDDLCDGELPAPAEAEVRRHLAGSGRCRRALARREATIADLRRLRASATPDVGDLRGRVERRIAEAPTAEGAQEGGA